MRNLTIIFCAALVIFSLHQAQAKIIHVPADSSTIRGRINGTSSGEYVITPETTESCEVECPPDGIPEGEPICYDGYVDNYNGGCGSSPWAMEDISCGDTICGTSGVFDAKQPMRDTDWFRVEVSEPAILTWSVVAEFPVLVIIIDAGSENCEDYEILDWTQVDPCDTATISMWVPAGVYWLWVGPSVFEGYPCGVEYVSEIRCGVCGDCNGDGVVDIADVVFLINYLFMSGPPPVPLPAGDVNLDSVVNIADVIYLINYLFVSGPPPAR